MPVVSVNTIVDPNQQRDGRRFLRFEWTVTGGEVIPLFGYGKYLVDIAPEIIDVINPDTPEQEVIYSTPPTQEEAIATIRANLEIKLNEQLERREAFETLEDSSKITSLNHATPQRVAELILRYVLRTDRIEDVAKAKPLVDYLKANYTAQQLQTATGLTGAQLTKIDNRVIKAEAYFTAEATALEDREENLEAEK